jgi:apolipoprotein N-acyltransferase
VPPADLGALGAGRAALGALGGRRGPAFRALGAAAAAAGLYTLACPPYAVAAAGWLVPGLLVVPCRGLSARAAAAAGVVFALGMGVGVTGWAYAASLAYFDFDRLAAAAFVIAVWLLYGGIPFGLMLAAYARAAAGLPPGARAAFAAAAWAVMEWLRTTLFTGMPWELLGHTQFRRLWLVQIADLGGVFAVSFVMVLASVAVGELLRVREPAPRRWLRRLAPVAAVLTATLAYGAAALSYWSRPSADGDGAVALAVVQGNVPNAFRWQRAHMERTLATYVGLTESTRRAQPDLVVWPENAVDFYLEREPMLRRQLARAAALAPGGLLVGSPRLVADGEARNSAQLLAADGEILARYDKQHLVPFAEASWPATRSAAAAEPVYGPGPRAEPVATAVGRLGAMICYEVIFPALVRDLVRRGAEVLVNLSNDSWLDAGDGAALEQHFSMAVFRAIETRRDLVRVASSGPSGFVDAAGRTVATVPRGTAGALVGRVRRRDGLTPYVRYGDAWLALAAAGVAAGLARGARARPAP